MITRSFVSVVLCLFYLSALSGVNYLFIFSGSCIFCLAAADELSFDAASTTVNMIRQLEANPNAQTDYKLVIICCSSQDYIASLLFEVGS